MRYLIILKSTAPPVLPPPELMDALVELGDEATKSGELLDMAGVLPSAMRVSLSGGELAVSGGPFPEAKEPISYGIYQVRDRDEAVAWAARFLRLYRDLWPGWEGEADILEVFGS